MRRTVSMRALAGLAFAGFLSAQFPAAWAQGALPPWLACDDVAGTVWNGSCTGLSLRHQQIVGDLLWQLHPLRLLALQLAAHVQLTRGTAFANGDFEWGAGRRLQGRNVHASL